MFVQLRIRAREGGMTAPMQEPTIVVPAVTMYVKAPRVTPAMRVNRTNRKTIVPLRQTTLVK